MAKFLILGGLAWDRVIRLSGPVAPGARLAGEILPAGMSDPHPLAGRLGGGAANAAVALVKAGCAVAVAGVLSRDDAGRLVQAALARAGVDMSLVQQTDSPSALTLILIDPSGERTIIGVQPANGAPQDQSLAATRDRLSGAVARRLAAEPFCGVFLRAPIRVDIPAGILTIAHWAGGESLPAADVVVASSSDIGDPDPGAAFRRVREVSGPRPRWLVLTHGAQGALAFSDDRTVRAPGRRVLVKDATGAGDIFAAGLMQALAARAGMEAALNHACQWGAMAASLDGSAPLGAPDGAFRPYTD
jgi:sugar/nucleoside kinase (ribokinase family)